MGLQGWWQLVGLSALEGEMGVAACVATWLLLEQRGRGWAGGAGWEWLLSVGRLWPGATAQPCTRLERTVWPLAGAAPWGGSPSQVRGCGAPHGGVLLLLVEDVSLWRGTDVVRDLLPLWPQTCPLPVLWQACWGALAPGGSRYDQC